MNKNQHDLSDDELDHLFRNSAEKMDFDFDPDSWTKMSQKLDAVNLPAPSENQAKNVWLKRGLPILLASLFFVGGYYVFTSSSKQATTTIQTKLKNSSENESKSNSEKYVTTDNVDTDNFKNKKTSIPESKTILENKTNSSESVSYENNKSKNSVIKSEEKNKILVDEKPVNSSRTSKNVIAENENPATTLENQLIERNKKTSKAKAFSNDKSNDNLVNPVISDTEKSLFVNEKNDVNNISEKNRKGAKSQKSKSSSEVNNTEIPTNQSSNILNQTPNSQDVASTLNSITKDSEGKIGRLQLGEIQTLAFKKGNFKSSINLPIIAFSSPKIEPVIPTSKSTSFKKGLYLRLGVSPDYSFITTDETARVGSNWSALLEYRFNSRFSVHSGVIRSMKYYNAYPASYEWPSNWGTIPYTLTDINASCKMFDIPLNFRFDITQKSKNRLFVGAGLTSYMMKNEKYTYNYENPNSSWIKWREWEGVSQKKPFYASNLNFSLGFEQLFFRKLSIQAEPFVKVPIKKVGFGKVNLSTIGIFISAKYPIAKF